MKSPFLFQNPLKALLHRCRYQIQIDKFIAEAKANSLPNECSICEKILTGSVPPNFKLPLNFGSITEFNDSVIEELHFTPNSVSAFSTQGLDYLNYHYYKSQFSTKRTKLGENSCIIYFARSNWRLRNDLSELFAETRSCKKVIVAVVKDEKRQSREYRTDLDFLTGFINKELGGFENSPLLNFTANWCLWLVEDAGSKYLNAMDLFKRASYEVLKHCIWFSRLYSIVCYGFIIFLIVAFLDFSNDQS